MYISSNLSNENWYSYSLFITLHLDTNGELQIIKSPQYYHKNFFLSKVFLFVGVRIYNLREGKLGNKFIFAFQSKM